MSGAATHIAARIEALRERVQTARGGLPLEVVRGWEDFYARWRGFMAALDAGALERRQLEAWLLEYARVFSRWLEVSRRLGVAPEGAAVGFDGFISPSRARARMDSVEASVTSLDEALLSRRAQLGEPFIAAWSRWRDAWRRFYRGYPRAWDWWYLGNGSAWNETLVYQERLGHWRRAAERAGARMSTPAPQSAPERRPGPDWASSARDIAVAGALGAVVLGAVYLTSKVT